MTKIICKDRNIMEFYDKNRELLFKVICFFAIFFVMSGCISKKDKKQIQSEADLKGTIVGAMTGTVYDIEFTKRKDFKLVRQPSISDLITSTKQRRLDAFVCDEISINSKVCEEQGIKMAFRTDIGFPCGFAFRKDEQDLVAKFNVFITELKSTGQLQTIIEKWTNAQDFAKVPMATDTIAKPDGDPLIMGTSVNVAPQIFSTGNEWRGFEAEIIELFGRTINRPIEYRFIDFPALAPALQSDAIDLLGGGLFITEERQKVFLMTEPYFECYGAFFVPDVENQANIGILSKIKQEFYNNLIVEDRWKFLARGLRVTIEITLLSILFGTMLGMLLYAMRRSRYRWINAIDKAYGFIMRGIPMVVLLMILFYVVFAGLNAIAVAVVAFSMTFAGFVAGITGTTMRAVGYGQYEAGIALGFSKFKTFRYIILPQAMRYALPHFKSQAVSLIKNTSIVGYIAIQDITRATDMIRSRTFEAFFPLLMVTIIYFILAWLLSKLIDFIFKLGMKI